MQEFSISRTVAREAVQVLSIRGLVDARPRFRPVVRAPGINTALDAVGSIVTHMLRRGDGVRNLFDMRTLVEAGLVREAAKFATKDDLTDLRRALDANGVAVNDNEKFFETDVAFHAVLYQVPENPALPAIHQAYTAWLSPHWSHMPVSKEQNMQNHADHLAIFDAILMRDADAAEDAMRRHLGGAWQQVSATFDVE